MVQRKEGTSDSVTIWKSLQEKKTVNKVFLKDIFPVSNESLTSSATTYGKADENAANKKYLELFQERHIPDCGLIINPNFPFLAGWQGMF